MGSELAELFTEITGEEEITEEQEDVDNERSTDDDVELPDRDEDYGHEGEVEELGGKDSW